MFNKIIIILIPGILKKILDSEAPKILTNKAHFLKCNFASNKYQNNNNDLKTEKKKKQV